MLGDGIFPGGSSESIHVIGYFPTKFIPSIPDAVVAKREGMAKMLFKDRSEKPCTDEEYAKCAKCDLHMTHGEWVVIDGELKIMSLADINGWRDRIATGLVQQAMETKGEPLRVLNMLESAAKLRSFDLADFVSTLNTQRANTDESLGEVFLRVRGNQAGGRTNR